ncbi:MAG: ABC transporter permease [Candidatus Sumerlaeia bacterium]|nr:ABC transporter permease [Candidatus Sumerlaeia bacterium]
MYEISAIALKDLRLLLRDKGGLFWVVGWPFINAIIFGFLFSGGGGGSLGGLSLAVVDNDRSALSAAYVAELRKNDALTVEELPLEAARNKVRKGQAVAALSINDGFGDGFGGLFADAGSTPTLQLLVDPSRTAEQGFLQGMLIQAQFGALSTRFQDRTFMRGQVAEGLAALDDYDPATAGAFTPEQRDLVKGMLRSADDFFANADDEVLSGGPFGGDSGGGAGFDLAIPVVGIEREANPNNPPTAFSITFPSGMLWGLLACCATFAVSIVQERERGTLRRLRISPVTPRDILLGKGLACFVACLFVLAMLLVAGALFFGLTVRSLPFFAMSAVSAAFAFVGIMMLLSTMGRTERAVGGSAWAVLLVVALLGGGMVPLLFMPEFMRSLSKLSPGRWAVYAFEGAIWRPLPAAEMLPAWLVLVGVGAVGCALGAWLLRRSEAAD